MIDDKFVREIVAATTYRPEFLDTTYRKKVLVVQGQEPAIFDDPREYEPVALEISTLRGITDFVAANIADTKVVVHVVSPTEVRVVCPVTEKTRQTLTYARAKPNVPQIVLGSYLSMEQFIIQLQSSFYLTDERMELQKLCGSIKAAKQSEFEDDGVSQQVNVATGVTRSANVAVPAQWKLAPFRSFPEINQPVSAFILRMIQKEGNDKSLTVQAALIEADGGAWRVDAISQIGDWLRETLPEGTVVLS